jgi:uncharacterized membrane protein
LDRRLRATSLVGTLLIPVAVAFFEGTLMHPIVALAAITSGLVFLWRVRGKLVHGKLLVGLAVAVSATWLVAIWSFATHFAERMAGFN